MNLQQEIAAWMDSRDGLFALLHLEVRFMRSINQAFGIERADALLAQVREHLLHWSGNEGLVAHPWGNEFTIVRPVDSPMDVVDGANALMATLHDAESITGLFPVEFDALHRYAVGVVIVREPADLDAGLRAAMSSCLEAKQRGASEIVFSAHDEFRRSRVDENVQNLQVLQRCLRERTLEIHAQPIVDLQSVRYPIVKAEILVRLAPNDSYGKAPGHLLETAQAMHVMPDVDLYILRFALEALAERPRILDNLESVSINLSAQTLMDAPAIREIFSLVRFSGIEARKIAFEITETEAVERLDETRDKLSGLRKLGCRLVLDDFGIGYCSFGYLSELAVDEVKIDGMFVRDIDIRPENEHIIRAIHSVAVASGKRTTAEFIEAAGVAERLRAIGIHYGQGWRFHPAMSLPELEALLIAE